jgi:hypothetical protein
MLWPLIYRAQNHIVFAHKSFPWSNLASNRAAVTCVIIGLSTANRAKKGIFDGDTARAVECIGPYLLPMPEMVVQKRSKAIHSLSKVDYGNKPTDGGNLILNGPERASLISTNAEARTLIRRYVGSHDFIHSELRYCLWINDNQLNLANLIPNIVERVGRVQELRDASRGEQANKAAENPHQFVFRPHKNTVCLVVPRHFSQRREYATVGILDGSSSVIADSASAIYGATLVDFAVLSSRLHLSWVGAVAGRIKTDYRYSSTLVWNTFPVPTLTEKNKADLTRCAEDILLAREAYFPTTIARLYDPGTMPSDLRQAHDRNDEVLERIYIGRKFRNDTERLEKLFELYTRMVASPGAGKNRKVEARA